MEQNMYGTLLRSCIQALTAEKKEDLITLQISLHMLL